MPRPPFDAAESFCQKRKVPSKTLLPKATIKASWAAFVEVDSDLASAGSFDLNTTLEALKFCQSFVEENVRRSNTLAMSLALLSEMKAMSEMQSPVKEVTEIFWESMYDPLAEIKSIQQKIRDCPALAEPENINNKIKLLTNAFNYLKKIVTKTPEDLQYQSFLQAAVAIIEDILVGLKWHLVFPDPSQAVCARNQ